MKELDFNSKEFDEAGATFYKNELIFSSNKKNFSLKTEQNEKETPIYDLYRIETAGETWGEPKN
ncbi:MAG: hypothetical protein HC896_07115 [Bacteroidales bacterium]|nr:hypothetical protein [Bacteroidales bacterium]